MIFYNKGSLFNDQTKGKLLAHACNAQGVWGSGIAAEFRERFPESYEEYKDFCAAYKNKAVGRSFVTSEGIVCFITSGSFGFEVDPPAKILENTILALKHFVGEGVPKEIHSNKFNSGLFNLPWGFTEAAIRGVLGDDLKYCGWTIWDPEM